MKALLMYRDRDFDTKQEPPHQHTALLQDLELDTLVAAMSGGDSFLTEVAQKALLAGVQNDIETIKYRQHNLMDCLNNREIVRSLYNITMETFEERRKKRFGVFSHSPSGVLYDSVELMQMYVVMLRRLREVALASSNKFLSEGFKNFFAMLKEELAEDYLNEIEHHLKELRFQEGILLSAELGEDNAGINYILRENHEKKPSWFSKILGQRSPYHTFRIDERDEAGSRILWSIQSRGINLVANTLAQSADHVISFFETLRIELGFYVGCMNLNDKLSAKGEPVCFPHASPPGGRELSFKDLYDPALSLIMPNRAIGNSLIANSKGLIVITGANQGGKSIYLRSMGLAQLMMQCGMFVAAEAFNAEICANIFTHYKREEDRTMKHGKLDEELSRMSDIVEYLMPNSLVLCNESFAATNEREGSEIARQVIDSLIEERMKVFYVTHLNDFARRKFEKKSDNVLFLRAERKADGTRTFKILEGEPQETSFGQDLYSKIFADPCHK